MNIHGIEFEVKWEEFKPYSPSSSLALIGRLREMLFTTSAKNTASLPWFAFL